VPDGALLALDEAGAEPAIYFAHPGQGCVYRLGPTGRPFPVLGHPSERGPSGSLNCPVENARLSVPQAIWVHDGVIEVVDAGGNLHQLDKQGRVRTLMEGSALGLGDLEDCWPRFSLVAGPGDSRFLAVAGVFGRKDGAVSAGRIFRLDPSREGLMQPTWVAGSGEGSCDRLEVKDARRAGMYPCSLVPDGGDGVLFADRDADCIRHLSPTRDGYRLGTLWGNGKGPWRGQGRGLKFPTFLTRSPEGRLIVQTYGGLWTLAPGGILGWSLLEGHAPWDGKPGPRWIGDAEDGCMGWTMLAVRGGLLVTVANDHGLFLLPDRDGDLERHVLEGLEALGAEAPQRFDAALEALSRLATTDAQGLPGDYLIPELGDLVQGYLRVDAFDGWMIQVASRALKEEKARCSNP